VVASLPYAAEPSAALPTRKALREALLPFTAKSTAIALTLIVIDFTLFFAGIALVAANSHLLIKVVASLLIWIQIARLFIIGHDACHQSLTATRAMNRWLGRLVFLPSLTPYKLWELGHNLAHHGFTNLRGKDYVWVPFSKAEYSQLSTSRQMRERYYRSGWGHWLYYLIELWWKKLYFPSKEEIGVRRNADIGDCLLVSAFAFVWIGGLIWAAMQTGQSATLNVVFGFILPFLLWNELMGFVIYVHHTDPEVRWYADSAKWAKAQPHISATIHIRFPFFFGALLHNIMEHPAHHLDMTIPLYNLKNAQRALETLVPDRICNRDFSLAWYRNCVSKCKLFDYELGKWQGF
jgi:omega-6 fatty acid desaturase (delta-12 desaturase)